MENTAIKLVEELNSFRANDKTAKAEYEAEVYQVKLYIGHKRDRNNREAALAEQEKQKKYKERGERDVKHYGRTNVARSEKPRVKKEEKKVEIPQQEKDYKTYLEDIAHIFLMSPAAVNSIVEKK